MNTRLDLYEKAVPLAKLGIWERNLITDEMYWNHVVRDIYELSDDVNPSVFESLLYYEEPHRLSALIEDAISTHQPQQAMLRMTTPLGNTKWVRVQVLATFDQNVCTAICGTIQDISEQEHMYQVLQEREQRFHQAFDYAPIGMAMLSLSGAWIRANDSLKDNLEYSNADLEGHSIMEMVHEEDLENLQLMSEKLISGQSNTTYLELRLYNKSGNPVWVVMSQALVRNAAGAALYVIAHIKDISERRKHTEILLKERKRLDNIIKGTGVGTWEWEIPSDQFYYTGRSAELLGFDKQRMNRDHMREWQDLIHPDDLSGNLQQLRNCFLRKTNVYCCECRMLHQSGHWIWMEIRGKVIKWSEQDEPLIMLGTFADIHARKSMEEQQSTALKVISEQNLKLLDFAHIVSHNLRSHTGNIQMLVEAIAQEQDKAEIDVMIGMLSTNVSNLQETLSNLNQAIKVQEKRDFDLLALNLLHEVKKAVSDLSDNIRQSKAEVRIDIPPELIVKADPGYLQNILHNLISNCLRYRSPDRALVVEILASPSDPISVHIRDNGLGIDLKMHGHKIFGMYKTFHGNADARGIGLFLVKNQIEGMGGKIKLESEPGKGSTFSLHFKADEESGRPA